MGDEKEVACEDIGDECVEKCKGGECIGDGTTVAPEV
jgi:hypothetical protein